eukprot:3639648-Rhodomonas_salina.1
MCEFKSFFAGTVVIHGRMPHFLLALRRAPSASTTSTLPRNSNSGARKGGAYLRHWCMVSQI